MPVDTTAPPPPPPVALAPVEPVAPWWHTVALFAVFAATTTFGHYHAPKIAASPSHNAQYISSIILEWILLGVVIAGVRKRRQFFRRSFATPGVSWLQALGFGLAAYVAGTLAVAIINGLLYLTPLALKHNTSLILALLPRTPFQFLLWFGVSITAGLTEEMIFRGYLQQQITAWIKRPVLAIVLASLLFGSVHLYEGLGAILPLAGLAFVYGMVVRYLRGDLRSVILAHTLQDFLIAMVVFIKPFMDQYAKQPH